MPRDPLDPQINQFEALSRWRQLEDGEGPNSKGEMLFCATRDAAIHARRTDKRLDTLNGSTERAISVLTATVEKLEAHILEHQRDEEERGDLAARVKQLWSDRQKALSGQAIVRAFQANLVGFVLFIIALLGGANIVIQFWK